MPIRPASADDRDSIFEIQREAFGLAGSPDRERGARRLADEEFADFLVLEHEGRVIGVVHIARRRLRVGRCVILKGDVGHVAVRPELQGRGHGTRIMRAAVQRMRENGFHVSRLGGWMPFYARFGYEPFPRRYVRIPVAPMDADLKGVPWAEIRALPDGIAARVRKYDPARDHAAVRALKGNFDRCRSGSFVLDDAAPPPPGTGEPDALEFVYEERHALRGYLAGALTKVHAADAEPSYCIRDFAVDLACPRACEALLKTFIRKAAQAAPTVISTRLPHDESLFAAITAADIAFEVVESHESPDGNMMQVLNLPALLEAVAPELSARLGEAGGCAPDGTVGFCLPGQEGALRVAGAAVSAAAPAAADVTVETDHATFLKWLFGICGFSESAYAFRHLAGPERLLLRSLFPRLPCASGPWG